MLDIPISCPFIPGGNKTIAKKSFVKVPLFGWFYRKGAVLVDRKSEISRRKSFEEMKKVLAMGMHCLLYTSDAADERSSVDLGGRRIIKKKKQQSHCVTRRRNKKKKN